MLSTSAMAQRSAAVLLSLLELPVAVLDMLPIVAGALASVVALAATWFAKLSAGARVLAFA